MHKLFICLTALIFVSGCCQADIADLEDLISQEMDAHSITGLTAAIVKEDQLLWTKGFGLANKAEGKPVADDTIFLIASVSKTVTAVALMTLYDQGHFALDDSINEYLPFTVTHPNYPKSPITFRMLLTHTSGISDVGYDDLDLYTYGKDSPITLEDFVHNYFVPGGKYYNSRKNFTKRKPGNSYSYSNMGYALIGYLVEAVAKMPFDQYCKAKIFAPLKMDRTAWFLRDLPMDQIAMPYSPRGKPYGQYTFPDYPNGQLRTTVSNLASFLSMFIQYGTHDGAMILKKDTAALMRKVAFPKIDPDGGLCWFYEYLDNKRLLGHNGGEQGVSSEMFFDPKTGVGGIVITTSEDNDLDSIISKLIDIKS